MKKLMVTFSFCVFSVPLLAVDSYAYIDPGTGSVFIQALVAALAAVGVSMGLTWRRLRALAVRLFSRNDQKRNQPDGE